MANRRLKLQEELEALTQMKVYFQPPENVRLTYPCILYDLDAVTSKYANNRQYLRFKRYSITVITPNPDDETAEKLLDHFKNAGFERRFKSDNLYHDVITVFY